MSLAGRILRRVFRKPDPPPAYAVGRGLIDLEKELPFLHEQVRSNWSTVPVRATGPSLLDNFTNETSEMRTAYRRAALAEPVIKTALLGKIAAVMALGLQVKPASDSPLDKEVADFVRYALTHSKGGLPAIVWAILSGGLIDGYSVCEKVYRQEERGRFKGKKSLLRLKSKDSRYVQFELDAFRNILRVFNMRGNAGDGFPTSDFVIFNYLSLFESPWGTSDLRAAFRAAEMIPACLRLRMIFLDKYTGGFLWMKVNDPAMVEEAKAQLALARSGGFIATTIADDLEVIDIAARGTSEFTAAIEDLRKEVAIGISGAFLHMMTGGGSDQRGDSQVQQDTVDLFIWLLAVMVAACLNEQLVGDLVDVNYGATTDLPVVSLEAPNPEAIVNELKIDESLSVLGVPLSLSELYERTGRRPPRDGADTVPHPGSTAPGIPTAGAPGAGFPGGNPLTVKGPAGFAEVDDEKRDDDGKWTEGGGGGGGAKGKSKKSRSATKKAGTGGVDNFGSVGADHPLAGMDRKAQVRRLADARPGIGDEPGELLGIDRAGPPPGLDMPKFVAAAADLMARHGETTSRGLDMPEVYAALGKPFGLSKHDFLRAITAAHLSRDIRLSGWGQMTDEIPDPELTTQVSDKLMYYVQPGDKPASYAEDDDLPPFDEDHRSPVDDDDDIGSFAATDDEKRDDDGQWTKGGGSGGADGDKRPKAKKPNAKKLEKAATTQATAYLQQAFDADRAGDDSAASGFRIAGALYHKAAGEHEDGNHKKAELLKTWADEYAAGKRKVGDAAARSD